jgi:hypothetical protein
MRMMIERDPAAIDSQSTWNISYGGASKDKGLMIACVFKIKLPSTRTRKGVWTSRGIDVGLNTRIGPSSDEPESLP